MPWLPQHEHCNSQGKLDALHSVQTPEQTYFCTCFLQCNHVGQGAVHLYGLKYNSKVLAQAQRNYAQQCAGTWQSVSPRVWKVGPPGRWPSRVTASFRQGPSTSISGTRCGSGMPRRS